LSDKDDDAVEDSILRSTHHASRWPIYVSAVGSLAFETTFQGQGKIDYYVVLLWPGRTHEETFENLLTQCEIFQNIETWNRRALFFVVITDIVQDPRHLALKIFDKLWKTENILNIILLLPANDEFSLLDNENSTETAMRFDVYTWFPYLPGHCASVEDATVIDRWIFTHNGHFSKEVRLFPPKIPKNLNACPLRVSALGPEPYAFLNDKRNTDNYEYRGLEIEYLLIISDVLNTTLVYLPSPAGTGVEKRTSMLMKLYFGSADVLLGTLPLHVSILEHADATISYLDTSFRWFVPCPTPVPKTEKVLGIFTAPVWFTLMIVHILMTVTVWWTGNHHCRHRGEESLMYRRVSRILSNVWAVSMGVSVAEMPRTSRLRLLFVLFVWYCFALSTIFQALFITFLVEPGFGKQIETFDELINSGVIYCFEENTEAALDIMSYKEYMRMKSPRLKCPEHDVCLERLITKQDIAMISVPFQANFIAYKVIPNYEKGKYACSIDQDIQKLSFVMYLQLGSPLVDRFNTIIRRTHEAGLVDHYWTMLKWETRVKGIGKLPRDGSDVDRHSYLALSLSHMTVSCYLLAIGYIVSLVAFIAELLYMRFPMQEAGTKRMGN
jgi:hypothetical protein